MSTTDDCGLRRGDLVDVESRTLRGGARAPGGPGVVEETYTPGRVTGGRVVLVRLDSGQSRLADVALVHPRAGRAVGA